MYNYCKKPLKILTKCNKDNIIKGIKNKFFYKIKKGNYENKIYFSCNVSTRIIILFSRGNRYSSSRRRAEAVKAKLIEFGLPEDRIVGIEAKGEEYPVATNETPEGRLQNRRVEFRLVQR